MPYITYDNTGAQTGTFTAGDSISAVASFSSGTSTNLRLQLIIEWL